MFTPLDAVQRGVGNTYLPTEVRVRKTSTRLPQKPGKLAIQMSLHAPRLAKLASRMRDDFHLQPKPGLLPE
jgi:hypothetical protein